MNRLEKMAVSDFNEVSLGMSDEVLFALIKNKLFFRLRVLGYVFLELRDEILKLKFFVYVKRLLDWLVK